MDKTNPITILIVDDEESILQVLEAGLKNYGFTVLVANDAKEALKYLSKTEIDLALIDILMPGMNGIELCAIIRKFKPHVTNILMTGYPGIKSAIETIRHNAFDYLIKPFRIEQVITVINKAVKEQEQNQIVDDKNDRIRELEVQNEQLLSMVEKYLQGDVSVNVPVSGINQFQTDDIIKNIRKYKKQQTVIIPDN